MIKVIFLDDEAMLCDFFLEMYSSEIIQINVFTDPEKAIEAANINPPDLIFLDYRLPYTNGDKVAHAMPEGIPKFLMTGDFFIDTKYPFVKILQKPVKEEIYQKIFQTYLDKKPL